MSLCPVLLSIPADVSLAPPQRVERQRLAARRALSLCARACGVADGPWEQDANRVPLPVGGCYWSISHKPRMAAAVIASQAVGIDVEHVAPRRHCGLWDRIADDREWDIAGGRSWKTFFRLWTAKEATVKAHGRGIGGFDDCRIVAVPDEHHVIVRYQDDDWQIEHFYHRDHIAAVTANHEAVQWLST